MFRESIQSVKRELCSKDTMFALSLLCLQSVCVLVVFRSKELEREVLDLRERIKHLNDMVFCQQRKVKGMIEEVSRLR